MANGGEHFADPKQMQRKLVANLSQMYGEDIAFNHSLAVSDACNRVLCDVLCKSFQGLRISEEHVTRCGEARQGAVRVGTAEEFRLLSRFFRCFDMEPHNFHRPSASGAENQPFISTTFRSGRDPEFMMLASLLRLEYLEERIAARVSKVLERQVFSDRARDLIQLSETAGGLNWADADELIAEATSTVFSWKGLPRERVLHDELCKFGHGAVADVACYDNHHLSHLSWGTLSVDLYRASMRLCRGEIIEGDFMREASRAIQMFAKALDQPLLRLLLRHLGLSDFQEVSGPAALQTSCFVEGAASLAVHLVGLGSPLMPQPHLCKDHLEGPPVGVVVILCQDPLVAPSESIVCVREDGTLSETTAQASHFGEIEQWFCALTPKGRDLYEQCLTEGLAAMADALDDEVGKMAYTAAFRCFPKKVGELLESDLTYSVYEATDLGRQMAKAGGLLPSMARSPQLLVEAKLLRREVQCFEDMLPAWSLKPRWGGKYDWQGCTHLSEMPGELVVGDKSTFSKAVLEEAMQRPIIDVHASREELQRASLHAAFKELGILPRQYFGT